MTSFIISCIPEPAIKETEIYADAARKTTGQEFHCAVSVAEAPI